MKCIYSENEMEESYCVGYYKRYFQLKVETKGAKTKIVNDQNENEVKQDNNEIKREHHNDTEDQNDNEEDLNHLLSFYYYYHPFISSLKDT